MNGHTDVGPVIQPSSLQPAPRNMEVEKVQEGRSVKSKKDIGRAFAEQVADLLMRSIRKAK